MEGIFFLWAFALFIIIHIQFIIILSFKTFAFWDAPPPLNPYFLELHVQNEEDIKGEGGSKDYTKKLMNTASQQEKLMKHHHCNLYFLPNDLNAYTWHNPLLFDTEKNVADISDSHTAIM